MPGLHTEVTDEKSFKKFKGEAFCKMLIIEQNSYFSTFRSLKWKALSRDTQYLGELNMSHYFLFFRHNSDLTLPVIFHRKI